MEEIWRDIKDYEGLYQVSNMGRVKNLGRWSNRQKNGVSFPYFIKEKILKNRKIKGGYYIVGLCNGKRNKTNGFKWEYYDTDKYLIALMNKNFKIKKVA